MSIPPLENEPSHACDRGFWFRGKHGQQVSEYADLRMNPTKLTSGTWALVAEFDGPWHAWKMEKVHECDGKSSCVIPLTTTPHAWSAPAANRWRSSMSATEYEDGVRRIRDLIAAGVIEQVNLCRILTAQVPVPVGAREMFAHFDALHPSPFGGWFDLRGEHGPGVWLVSASPELAFEVFGGVLASAPIKGTAASAEQLLPKDYEENRLVTAALVERVRDFLGNPHIVSSCQVEQHPDMVQLVSRLEGKFPGRAPDVWHRALTHLLPTLSVTGVPVLPALEVIDSLESAARGPYCGVVGWIDVDRHEASLGAMIRSFWWEDGHLKFGTGAGITAGSDPQGEWQETEFKANSLLSALSRAYP